MKKIGEVIRQIRKDKGLTIAEVADLIPGYDAGNLSRFERGEQDIAKDKLNFLSKILNISISNIYKMAECGIDSFNENLPIQADNDFMQLSHRLSLIPLISWVRAGELCLTDHIFNSYDADEWRYCHIKHSEHTYALTVSGDSMYPEYLDGCDIYVDPQVRPEHNDDVVVCTKEGKATFKRLQITNDGQFLMAINPDYPDRIIKVPEDTIICGVVIYSGKKTRKKGR
jgi:SOS-response transcriptional repressor LexA